MEIIANQRLFWFLRENAKLDLDNPSILDMYVQQVVLYGVSQDVRRLIDLIGLGKLRDSLKRIGPFLSWEVRRFWEDYFGNT
mgnify:CR=1 FL=1